MLQFHIYNQQRQCQCEQIKHIGPVGTRNQLLAMLKEHCPDVEKEQIIQGAVETERQSRIWKNCYNRQYPQLNIIFEHHKLFKQETPKQHRQKPQVAYSVDNSPQTGCQVAATEQQPVCNTPQQRRNYKSLKLRLHQSGSGLRFFSLGFREVEDITRNCDKGFKHTGIRDMAKPFKYGRIRPRLRP